VAGKDEKRKKENAIRRFFRETSGELKKVTWPTRQEAWNLTKIVLIVMVLMSVFLWLVDLGSTKLLALAVGS